MLHERAEIEDMGTGLPIPDLFGKGRSACYPMAVNYALRLFVPFAVLAAASPSACSSSSATPGTTVTDGGTDAGPGTHLRIGQFNLREMSTNKIIDDADEEATAATEIIARFAPDIMCLNEIEYDIKNYPTAGVPGTPYKSTPGFDDGALNAQRIADRVHAKNPDLSYSDTLITRGNSGFSWKGDTNGSDSFVLRGWGEYPGRFNTVILSKYPIRKNEVRVIADYPWEKLPDNKIAELKTASGLDVPKGFPLFEKSLNIIPIEIGTDVLYLVMLHPTAPVYDPINAHRNFDEIHALKLFLDGTLPDVEPLPVGAKFIVVGDMNADPDDGDGLPGTIAQVLNHPSLIPNMGKGSGTKGNHPEYNSYLGGCGLDNGSKVTNPDDKLQLQLDYLLPSKTIGQPSGGAVFFPAIADQPDFDLACRASDHRMAYVDLAF